jgi:hypothetical protein
MKLSKTYNLSVVNPGLAVQWHPVKNGHLKPEDVTPGSGKKVWWVCEKGHEWLTRVESQNRKGSGCPYCFGRRVNKENCLKTKNPSLASQWHPVKNGDLTPEDVTANSNKKVWWLCAKDHEWQAQVNNRNMGGSGCPYCSGRGATKENCLKTNNPSLTRQWHPDRNGDLTPDAVTANSNKKVWWICTKGHEWQAQVNNRNIGGSGCPYCAGKKVSKENCFKTKNPLIAGEWHPLKNGGLTPENVTPGSNKKAWWLCAKGHEWNAVIVSRNKGHGCPYCLQKSAEYKLTISNPALVEMWHPEKNGNLTPADVTANSTKKVWWLCKKGHEWREKVYLQDRSQGCPFCQEENPHKKSKNRFGISAFRGFYKPRVKGNDSQSSPLQVQTTFEEKKTIRVKGKIKECRKMTSYARYVYGLDRIPEGWVIFHIDGDPLNNNIENLECISRSELLRRNSKYKYYKNP